LVQKLVSEEDTLTQRGLVLEAELEQ